MKTSQATAFAAVIIAMCLTTPYQAAPNEQPGSPSIPVGWLTAFPSIVQTGTHPELNWSLEYPKTVLDKVSIQPAGQLILKEGSSVEVRVVAASSDSSSGTSLPVETWINPGTGSWSRVFTGTEETVDPTKVVYRQEVPTNATLYVGSRTYDEGWGPFEYTGSGSSNVVTLVDGDSLPEILPNFNEALVNPSLAPYVDGSGNVEIGPQDVIILYELDQPDPTHTGHEHQDVVVLVTFNRPVDNNGHGNNIDGIDASNPGDAPFIVNDTDPNVDDEGSGGGAWPKWEGSAIVN